MLFFLKKHKDLYLIASVAAIFLFNSMAFAQVKSQSSAVYKNNKSELSLIESKLSASVDVVYPNLSRGILLNSLRLAFQANTSYNFTDRLTFGIWVTTNFSSDATAYNEYDFTLSYQVTPCLLYTSRCV